MPIQLQIKTVGAKLVRQGLEDFDKAIPEIGRLRIYRRLQAVRRKLSQKPRPIFGGKVDWDSKKQRKFVMAKLRKQGLEFYIPTGRYEANWEIVKHENGYSIENDAPFAKYASGDFRGESQSHIHEGRRPLMARVVEDEIQNLPEEIDGAISYYGRGHGLIP
jgi:hypothetical protein